MRKTFAILLVLSLLGLGLGSCNSQQVGAGNEAATSTEKTLLSVFAAGSLIIPFGDIEKAFEAKYPNIDVRAEYHGSIQAVSYTHLTLPTSDLV